MHVFLKTCCHLKRVCAVNVNNLCANCHSLASSIFYSFLYNLVYLLQYDSVLQRFRRSHQTLSGRAEDVWQDPELPQTNRGCHQRLVFRRRLGGRLKKKKIHLQVSIHSNKIPNIHMYSLPFSLPSLASTELQQRVKKQFLVLLRWCWVFCLELVAPKGFPKWSVVRIFRSYLLTCIPVCS